MSSPLIMFLMDPFKVTDDLPILKRLYGEEKAQVIAKYQEFLRSKPINRVIRLRNYMIGKLKHAQKGNTLYHRALSDQYNRIVNIIENTLVQWPLRGWGTMPD